MYLCLYEVVVGLSFIVFDSGKRIIGSKVVILMLVILKIYYKVIYIV